MKEKTWENCGNSVNKRDYLCLAKEIVKGGENRKIALLYSLLLHVVMDKRSGLTAMFQHGSQLFAHVMSNKDT